MLVINAYESSLEGCDKFWIGHDPRFSDSGDASRRA
jgi:hypothetical protein